ncbi:hypothetical protein CU669_18360 [Paramagnetospirillum kuznetsovii]|uniref:Uncharacterized protein n=2 Tax=Paramagnetospirillum kuznetsovii TaxID=2053833 RepID=A0A364NU64_9PROT|nr:hypothetical protein CU669_18360 [Paramagnetospirillum kuznetsovii]
MEINRLAAQLAANIAPSASDDDVLRLCIGMALSQDMTDEELALLVSAVDQYDGRREKSHPTAA